VTSVRDRFARSRHLQSKAERDTGSFDGVLVNAET